MFTFHKFPNIGYLISDSVESTEMHGQLILYCIIFVQFYIVNAENLAGKIVENRQC